MIKNDLIAAVLASILMVILDLNLEIVAVELNFWQWHQESIPLSNYVTWFLVAFIIQMVYRKASFEKENPLHLTLFFNLLFFFWSFFQKNLHNLKYDIIILIRDTLLKDTNSIQSFNST